MSDKQKQPRQAVRYQVIRFRDGGTPCLGRFDGDKWLWGGGPSYCILREGQYTLLKEYEFADDPSWEELELPFYKEFAPATPDPLTASGGWISPAGEFFQANSMEHDGVAKRLAAVLHDSREGMTLLEENGWVHFYQDGLVAYNHERGLTAAQRKTLESLAVLFSNAGRDAAAREIYRGLETYGVRGPEDR